MCDVPDHFYVTLFSNASKDIYPNNTPAAFTLQVAQAIELRPSDWWEVGVCEFTCPPPKLGTFKDIMVIGETSVLIYCNRISPQIVGKKAVRCLTTFIYPSGYCQHVFRNIYYVPVEKKILSRNTHRDIDARRYSSPLQG
jgi:hypothetical protein